MVTRALVFGLCIVVLCLPTRTFAATPFTFSVKTSAQNMHPDVKEIVVICRIFHAVPLSNANQIGHGTGRVSMQNRQSYAGLIKVPVQMSPGKNPADAVKYSCTLYYSVQSPPGSFAFRTDGSGPVAGQADPSQPFVQVITGDL